MLYMGYSIPDKQQNSALYIGINPHHYTITLALPDPPQACTICSAPNHHCSLAATLAVRAGASM